MVRPWVRALVALVSLGAVAALAYTFTEGALAPGTHVWRVEVYAPTGAPWSVEVPALAVDAPNASDADGNALDALYSRLHVAKGSAAEFTIERERNVVRLTGRGDAVFASENRVFDRAQREAFTNWVVPEPDVRRLDSGTGQVQVTWIVNFHGGGGRTCWGQDAWSAHVAEGEAQPLLPPSIERPPGKLWLTHCA